MENAVVSYTNGNEKMENVRIKHFFENQIKPKLERHRIVEIDDDGKNILLHMMYFVASKFGLCAKISHIDGKCKYYFWIEE